MASMLVNSTMGLREPQSPNSLSEVVTEQNRSALEDNRKHPSYTDLGVFS